MMSNFGFEWSSWLDFEQYCYGRWLKFSLVCFGLKNMENVALTDFLCTPQLKLNFLFQIYIKFLWWNACLRGFYCIFFPISDRWTELRQSFDAESIDQIMTECMYEKGPCLSLFHYMSPSWARFTAGIQGTHRHKSANPLLGHDI